MFSPKAAVKVTLVGARFLLNISERVSGMYGNVKYIFQSEVQNVANVASAKAFFAL